MRTITWFAVHVINVVCLKRALSLLLKIGPMALGDLRSLMDFELEFETQPNFADPLIVNKRAIE